ncbi:MAG: DUF4175 family protein [Deltaproteobacteria bacterium]|nr:DUF4175 family protein [Deltaproteobacteria bacterium]
MTEAYAEIARVLARARRREGRIVLLSGLAFGLAGVLLSGLLGALALARGFGQPGAVRSAALAGMVLALLGAAGWAAFALLRRAASEEAVARSLGRAEPALRSDLLSAVELRRDYAGLAAAGYSLPLVDAHIGLTAGRTSAVDLRLALPSRPAVRAGLFLLAAAAVNLLALPLAGKGFGAGWARLLGLGPDLPVVQADPITGDVELTFLYPAHTGRPPRTVSGTGGEITAPRGTEVRLQAKADRPVEAAELRIEPAGGAAAPASPQAGKEGAPPPGPRLLALQVKDGRQLSAALVVDEPGSYRFRFKKGKRLVAEGPPIPIAVEPDAFPEVRITFPGPDVEVDAGARPRIDWTASDDHGLSALTLVLKPAAGQEERRPLRRFESARRESGSFDLDLPALRLAEGERLLYWLEVEDNDAVSGPKRGASATQVIRIYSEAEHRQRLMEKAQALWEQMVRLLGDRLEALEGVLVMSRDKLAQGQALDGRTRALHEGLRETAAALRKDKAAPRSIPDALLTAAAGIRAAEQPLSIDRATAVRLLSSIGQQEGFWRRLQGQDQALDRELEKDVLYLEQLLDRERAQDLVRLAKELQARRRDLASLLDRYRQAPSDEARRQLLAEIGRMKQRMRELASRMAELAKGINDEHMNMEALAEMSRQQDALSGLDQVEEMLQKGDLEGAMKALDALGSEMQEMVARLERTAGRPGEKNRELVKEMREFEQKVREVEKQQEQVAGETEQVRQEYRKRLAEELKRMGEQAGRLQKLTREAQAELQKARDGLSPRGEEEWNRSREALSDLEKALAARDFDAALESARKAVPSVQRLGGALEDDAMLAERFGNAPGQKGPMVLREAAQHAQKAAQPARKVKDELEKLFPDPQSVLGKGDQQRLEQLGKRQGELERQAGGLRQKLQQLAEKAPVFPPGSQAMLGEAQGHMGEAAGDLARRNPQKGHGRQKQALDALGRFRKGLEEMAKNARGGSGQEGDGFPMPFAMGGGEAQGGEEGELSREKVEIPGAEAYKVPEEFRRDILEAMKQGAPEPYRPELQRYYQELVK